MGRRAPIQAGWRLLAIIALVMGLVAGLPRVASAASVARVLVTDTDGTPLAGAAFAVYPAVTGADGALTIPDGAAVLAGPFATGSDGLLALPDLGDGLTVGVEQVGIPPGYTADPEGTRFVVTGPSEPVTLTFVNALATSTASVPSTVVVAVSGEGIAIAGASVEVTTVDPATGGAGEVVATGVSGADGAVALDLTDGDYLVSVVPPAGYLAPDTQPLAVATDDGTSVESVAFDLQAADATDVPLEPTATVPPAEPTEPVATETPAPAEPTATTPAEPTAPATEATEPAAPADTPTAEATASATPDARPNATIVVQGIVCVSGDADLAGTMVIDATRPVISADAMPPECRPATGGELSFAFRDPRTSSPWDDVPLGRRDTDADGYASFDTLYVRDGQAMVIAERSQPGAFSDPIPLVPGGTVAVVAIRVVSQFEGDVVIRTTDTVSGELVTGICYSVAASGLESLPLASACDVDDGEDGVVTFGDLGDGEYVVQAASGPDGYVLSGATALTIGDDPVELSLSAAPFGIIQPRGLSCAAVPANAIVPVLPADGDGISGLTEGETPAASDRAVVAFVVSTGRASTADGTMLDGRSLPTGCGPAGGELEIVSPDGSVTPVTVASDGVGLPVSLPPTVDGATYLVRDVASGGAVTVAVSAGRVAEVTVVNVPVMTGTGDNAPAATPSASAAGGTVVDLSQAAGAGWRAALAVGAAGDEAATVLPGRPSIAAA